MKKSGSFADFMRDNLSAFFVLVTLMNINFYIMGMIFFPDTKFGYEAFIIPILNGAIGMLPVILSYSRKELTIRQLMVRKLFQLVLIELIFILIQLTSSDQKEAGLPFYITLALSIFIIFLLVHLIEWIIEARTARQMNDVLADFQRRNSE